MSDMTGSFFCTGSIFRLSGILTKQSIFFDGFLRRRQFSHSILKEHFRKPRTLIVLRARIISAFSIDSVGLMTNNI